jgi:uncharacterized membrane protein
LNQETESSYVFNVVLIFGIVAVLGFAIGVRPGRHGRLTGSIALLLVLSVIVCLAAWMLVSKDGSRRLRDCGADDDDMIVMHALLSVVCLVGSVVSIPAWGYFLGRTVRK